jgi:hypothetical protein
MAMLDVRAFTYGVALGAGAMFLYDPERGASRRARFREASTRIVHRLEHGVAVGRRDLANRVHGVEARARALPSRSEPVSPDVLIARVRSRLGRVSSHAHAIQVNAKEGNGIELKGPALSAEHDRIVRAASRVRGVRFIDDDLVVYAEADGVAGLQGGAPRASHGGGKTPPATRLLMGVAIAGVLVSPLAPMLVKTAFYATLRTLFHDITPEAMRAFAGGEERLQGEEPASSPERRERREPEETSAYPT